MPKEDGTLTEPETAKVVAWLKATGSEACPYCSTATQSPSKTWVGVGIYRMTPESENNRRAKGLPQLYKEEFLPVLVLMCNRCSSIRTISPTAVGIMKAPNDNQKTPSKLGIITGT